MLAVAIPLHRSTPRRAEVSVVCHACELTHRVPVEAVKGSAIVCPHCATLRTPRTAAA